MVDTMVDMDAQMRQER
jgi:hypothetical protein